MVKLKLPDNPKLSRSQWAVIGLAAVILIAAVIGAIPYFTKPTLIVAQDYAPFASLEEYEQFNRAHPLLAKQAPDDAHFRYKTRISEDKKPFYQIYLRVPPVKGGSDTTRAEYAKLLRAYQKEAIEWFASHDEDLEKAYVQWFPNPVSYEPTPTPTARPRKLAPGK